MMNNIGVLEKRKQVKLATRSSDFLKRENDRYNSVWLDSDDIIVQCPKCKALETLQFVAGTLTPCRKFSQREGMTYHDCGSDIPCRLHK